MTKELETNQQIFVISYSQMLVLSNTRPPNNIWNNNKLNLLQIQIRVIMLDTITPRKAECWFYIFDGVQQ